MGELSDRLIAELVDAVRQQLRKEAGERLRDVYLVGDIENEVLNVNRKSDRSATVLLTIDRSAGKIVVNRDRAAGGAIVHSTVPIQHRRLRRVVIITTTPTP